MTGDKLQTAFASWCEKVADDVVAQAPSLRYAHGVTRGTAPGHFSYDGRLLNLHVNPDGTVSVAGLEAGDGASNEGRRMPRLPVLFPGGLRVAVPMNDDGARLAVRAIVTWLSRRDEAVPELRIAFGQETK